MLDVNLNGFRSMTCCAQSLNELFFGGCFKFAPSRRTLATALPCMLPNKIRFQLLIQPECCHNFLRIRASGAPKHYIKLLRDGPLLALFVARCPIKNIGHPSRQLF